MTSLREAFGDDGCPCVPGEFCSSRGTCLPCPTGYACLDDKKTICSAGTYSSEEGASKCTPCKAGYYSAAGAEVCTPCQAGTRSKDSGATSCTPCSAGWYQDKVGQSECTQCDAGEYSGDGGPTDSGATSCTPCPAGTYNYANNCTDCFPGTYSDSTGVTKCTPCETGTTSAAGATECKKCGCDWKNSDHKDCYLGNTKTHCTAVEHKGDCEGIVHWELQTKEGPCCTWTDGPGCK